MNIIYILILRQLKRYLRARSRIIGSLGQPILFLLAMGFGLGSTYAQAGGGNYIQFISPGIIAMGILFTAVFSGIEIIWDRQFGFLKETLVAPVSRLHIVLGRTLGGALIALIQGLIVFAICILVGFRIENMLFLPLGFGFMILIAIMSAAVGTAIGSLLEDMQSFPLIINFLVMPLFFFSGALFPIHGIPHLMRAIIYLNPLSYGVDGLRGALSHTSHYHLGLDFLILSLLTLVLLGIASYLFSKIQL